MPIDNAPAGSSTLTASCTQHNCNLTTCDMRIHHVSSCDTKPNTCTITKTGTLPRLAPANSGTTWPYNTYAHKDSLTHTSHTYFSMNKQSLTPHLLGSLSSSSGRSGRSGDLAARVVEVSLPAGRSSCEEWISRGYSACIGRLSVDPVDPTRTRAPLTWPSELLRSPSTLANFQ